MRAKLFLVLAVGLTMMFSEGCAISINGQQIGLPGIGGAPGAPQSPLGSLDPAALAAAAQGQGNPLTGSLQGALPQDPNATVPGLTTQPPTFTPASPSTTPVATPGAPIDPNASTPQALAGVPQATPVGTGPIDPASLPTLPAAGVNDNPLSLAAAVPPTAGL